MDNNTRKKSVVDEVGKRLKKITSVPRREDSGVMRRAEDSGVMRRKEDSGVMKRSQDSGMMRGAVARRRESDGFQDAESYDWFFGALFFVFIVFILSPGVLLTIPPGRGKLLMSGSTSILAAFVHAVLLVTLLSFI